MRTSRSPDMAIKLGKTPDGATVTLLDREIRGAYDAAKWNLARSLFGDGTGILGTFSSLIETPQHLLSIPPRTSWSVCT